MTQFIKTHLFMLVFVFLYLIFTFGTYKNYAITADEEYRYKRGAELLQHFLTSKPLQTTIMPTIEPDIFSFYAVILNVLNPKGFYEIFHLLNMLSSILVMVAGYLIILTYTKSPKFSIIFPIFLLLTPNFSGHFPANPIDIPFSSMLLISAFLVFYFKNSSFSFSKIIILGVSFWLTQCLRPAGYQIYVIYIFTALLYKDKSSSWKNFILTETKTLALIFVVSSFLTVITWPYIAINYFKNLPNLLVENASFTKWDNEILFMGNYIHYYERPWYYLFVYLFLTVPLYIIGFGIMSLRYLKNKLKLVILFTLAFNIVLYLGLQPTIYNGMRHFIFIIPLFVVLACFGFWDLINSSLRPRIKAGLLCVSFFGIFMTLLAVIRMYPYQYAYFNELSGGFKNVVLRLETEYWGAMYKNSAEYIRDNLTGPNPEDVKVYACNVGYAVDYYSHKKFIVTIDRTEADYVICDYPEDLRRGLTGSIVHQDYLEGVPFMVIRENLTTINNSDDSIR